MRAIFEELGAKVEWDESTGTVTGVLGETTVTLSVGNTVAFVNWKPKRLDVPPEIINDKTMVPVRFIAESLGADVFWQDSTQTVIINHLKNQTMSNPAGLPLITVVPKEGVRFPFPM